MISMVPVKWCGIAAAATVVLLLAGCSLFSHDRPPVITGIGWVIENIDASVFTRSGDTAPDSTFRNFWLTIDDPNGEGDIVYIQVTDPDGNRFKLHDMLNGLTSHDPNVHNRWGGWQRLYDADSPSRVPLGWYSVIVRDYENNEDAATFRVTSPAAAAVSSGFLYDDTSYAGDTTGGTPMLRRATSVSGTWLMGPALRIDFTVDDARVFNVSIWFYGNSGELIGGSGYLRDKLNDGAGLNTSGANSITFYQWNLGDLDLGTHSLSDIRGAHVTLLDGVQYAPAYTTWWDHRSISAYASF